MYKNNIISLSGIHNCGKTTTFNKLKDYYKSNNNILFILEVNNILNKLGLGINDNNLSLISLRQSLAQGVLAQIESYLSVHNNYDCIIMDRCSLDSALYTYYFADNGLISLKNEEKFSDNVINIMKTWYKDSICMNIIYFGMDKWIKNKRKDSMDKKSGYSLETNYFSKFNDIMIPYKDFDWLVKFINLKIKHE